MSVDAVKVKRALEKMPYDKRVKILRQFTPRVVEPYMAHIPHPKQQLFLMLNCREAMYGGAAGGGKSDAVLMSALQYVDVPGYSALILRKTWPDLNAPGAILDRARTWLAGTDAHMRDGGRTFIFPSGAKLSFGYMQREQDKYKFQSAEYQFIGFDELTHFEESPYLYLFSRLRRPNLVCLTCGNAVRKYATGWAHTSKSKENPRCSSIFPDPKVVEQYPPSLRDGLSVFDIPLRMRSATNPGGVGNEWVKQRFVNKETKEPDAVFVPAKLQDNPSLDRESYRDSLSHLSVVDRERLENGDWEVAETGDFFERSNFNIIERATPPDRKIERVRFWDMAGTEGGGDWTACALVAFLEDGTWEVQDIWRGQVAGAKQERIVAQFAAQDGRDVPIRMEQEPGSAGKNLIDHYARNVLYGYDFDGERSTGSKTDRAYPVKVSSEKKHVTLVMNQFIRDFLNEAEAFPTGPHDDMVDAVSGAVTFLSFGRRGRLLA